MSHSGHVEPSSRPNHLRIHDKTLPGRVPDGLGEPAHREDMDRKGFLETSKHVGSDVLVPRILVPRVLVPRHLHPRLNGRFGEVQVQHSGYVCYRGSVKKKKERKKKKESVLRCGG